jgi:hypothetical protein
MAIEHVERRLPFACQAPHLNHQLPSHGTKSGQASAAGYNSDGYKPISFELRSGTPTHLGPYPREAQAAYLLSQVLDHIVDENVEPDTRQQQGEGLDQSLQSILMSTLQPIGYSQGDYCGAYSTSMR